MKILVFLQGTVIMHQNAAGLSRTDIIQHVKAEEESVRDFSHYIPIGNASQKLQKWAAQGAEISYLSALTENKKARKDERIGNDGLRADELVLERYHFPKGTIYHRASNEDYKNVVERILPLPDILIEDDCESIGGKDEMTYPYLSSDIKKLVKSIVVKEFGGIDYLPDDIELFSNSRE